MQTARSLRVKTDEELGLDRLSPKCYEAAKKMKQKCAELDETCVLTGGKKATKVLKKKTCEEIE